MILIGGASAVYQNGMGAFQEERQVLVASPLSKYAHAVEEASRIPYYVEQAVRSSLFGVPGASYLDLPDDVLTEEVALDRVYEASTVSGRPLVQPRTPRQCGPRSTHSRARRARWS